MIQKIDIRKIDEEINFKVENRRLVVLGNPGTGKTHGIADCAKSLLNDDFHMPILVQAKAIESSATWRDIITDTLGLSQTWSEEEIWNGLEAVSYRKQINFFRDEDDFIIIPKILICIDGLDEVVSPSIWIKRVREMEGICKSHKRIRICITSRHNVFSNEEYKDILFENKVELPDDGDCSVAELFDKYIETYDITIINKPWIKWTIKTPLALKLFCQSYEGKTIEEYDKVSLTITQLISKRIDNIDCEFRNVCNEQYSEREFIVKKALILLADLFIKNKRIEREDIYNCIRKNDGLKILKDNHIGKLIDYLYDYGIIYSYGEVVDDFFSIPKVGYTIGMQPFFEFIIALNISKNYSSTGKIEISKRLERSFGVLQMLSVILLEDYNILLNDIESIKLTLRQKTMMNLAYFALSNVGPNIAERHKDFVCRILNSGRSEVRECVNKLLLPVSRAENHPLGASLLHDFLVGFTNVGARDRVWSLPEAVVINQLNGNYGISSEGIMNERYKLTKNDSFNGLPIIYAWSLTTVENEKRTYCRNELVKWAITKITDYYQLLKVTYKTNDPQMKEDLMAITMSVVFSGNLEKENIKLFSDWVIENIFSDENIVNTKNAAIRYYGRAIVEYAYENGLLLEDEVKLARPPYRVNDKLIGLNTDALKGTRMDGYFPIDYDLSRYVLCDLITGLFFSDFRSYEEENEYDCVGHFNEKEALEYLGNSELNTEARQKLESLLPTYRKYGSFDFNMLFNNQDEVMEDDIELEVKGIEEDSTVECDDLKKKFLVKHAESIDEEYISDEQFIISAAYKYILELGWSKNDFYGDSKNEEDAERLIVQNYYPATHGQRSSVMTFAEKYVWCARNEICGYLADRITLKEDAKIQYLNDYGLIDDFPNPSQEIFISNNKENEENKLIFLDGLFPLVDLNCNNLESINKLILSDDTPKFKKWIHSGTRFSDGEKCNNVVLYGYSSLTEQYDNVESIAWISSLMVDKKDLKLLLNDLDGNREHIVKELKIQQI